MRALLHEAALALAVLAVSSASGQSVPASEGSSAAPALIPQAAPATDVPGTENLLPLPPAVSLHLVPTADDLLAFQESDVKFDVRDLVEILSDRRHEGWVLAAYPDPKTSQPLIGAGFSLDLPARVHIQTDPLNPHPFLEPSSADLWRIAGLEPQRLNAILEDFNQKLLSWKKKKFRKKIASLEPQITDEEAEKLVRVAALQAIYNAMGYCRNFDRLTASQQMAMSQLVYQMGVNLQEFGQFLTLINSDAAASPQAEGGVNPDATYWKAVQTSLVQSQWARLYRTRAIAVIAMLDPQYSYEPSQAESHVSATLRPAVLRRGRARKAGSMRRASLSAHERRGGRSRKSHARRN